MNEMQIFNNLEFGEIRTVTKDDKTYFVGNDVAKALGYVETAKAIRTHCKGVSEMDIPSNGGIQRMKIITEGDIYRLVVKSQLPQAEKFESWIFDEVLPSIRRQGNYHLPQTTDGKIMLLAQGHVELKEEVDTIKADLEILKMDLPILPIEADKITEAVKRKGVQILGGKTSNAYNDRSLRQKLYNNLYSNIKYNFGVKSYKAIKRSQCDKALEVISNYIPPVFLSEQIEGMNAQQKLEW